MFTYVKIFKASVASQMQHKASFFMLLVSNFIATFVEIFGVWILFDRFKLINGWNLPELMLICGIVHMGFAFADSFGKGFEKFGHMIKRGEFDRFLLRPIGLLFQISARDFQLMRMVRFFQGAFLVSWGFWKLSIPLLPTNLFIVILSFMGMASVFYGLLLIQATVSFWTVEMLEIMSIATYGGVEACKYPMSIYNRSFRFMFTILIPLACVGYYPVAIILKRESIHLGIAFVLPLLGFVFLYLAIKFWIFGVSRYNSTGS